MSALQRSPVMAKVDAKSRWFRRRKASGRLNGSVCHFVSKVRRRDPMPGRSSELLGALILLDDDWEIVSGNGEWERWCSKRPAGSTGKLWSFIHPDDCKRLTEVLASWIRSGTTESIKVPIRMMIPTRAPQTVLFRFGKLSGSNHWCGTFSRPPAHDVAEGGREYIQRRLGHAENLEALGRLVGGVAHDFRNHLTMIIGMAEMLLHHDLEQTQQNMVRGILSLGIRSRNLTNQVLVYAKKAQPSFARVDIHDVITALTPLLGHGPDPQIAIMQCLDAPNSIVQADLTQIQNALMNLALNALEAMEHMQDGGILIFTTSNISIDKQAGRQMEDNISPGNYLRISIEDTGHGIDADSCQRIFEPFYTTKAYGKGTGLGLASVRATIRQHFGTIQVQSVVGSGTRFEVLLPTAL